ncbi:hypothetical protein [Haliangium ochraceum]|uniref:Uncharacterized protein n=1 Tax=Haliangium ochraceum (strain DSM 14365 / JCM 11303 / SMP-2) TaxID=502025 RepID=D0LVV2_HALO1|nr:hypothetical protein [Haliangium ochraceum]ACY14086.1 hypothetical protein Hoch_1534 [Haliangium ochraceum DSM 14365]
MPSILTANRSSFTVDGATVEGIQSISYREVREQADIMAVGSEDRIGVAFGARRVVGTIIVASSSSTLSGHLAQQTQFQIVVNLKKETGTGQGSQTVTFDDCYVHDQAFSMAASGTALTTYEFTATSMRIE